MTGDLEDEAALDHPGNAVVKPLTVGFDPWETHEFSGYENTTNKNSVIINYASVELFRLFRPVPLAPRAIAGDNPRGFLCPTLARTRVDGRCGLSRQFAHLMSAAGLDQDQVRSARNAFSRKSFHSLQHSFSSALANAGVSADLRMRLTGHKSLVVHQRYSHVELEPLRKAISILPRLSGEDEG